MVRVDFNDQDKLEFAEEILKSIINNASEQVIDECVLVPISIISDINYYFGGDDD